MRPILLDPSKTLTQLAADRSNGLGVLEPTSCTVTEERNSVFDLSMILPITSAHYADLANGSLIRAKVADGTSQMFRVYRMQKMMSGLVEVDAHHVSYDLAKAPVKPFTASGASSAVAGLKNNLMADYPFDISTDIENTSSTFTLDIPRTFRECLGGYSGSILDVFGGVYKWNNLTVQLLANRGTDKGVRIAYGKNLTDIDQEANIEAVYDAVLGYAEIGEAVYYGDIVYATERTQPKVKIVDFSDRFESNATPTKAQINQLASEYIDANDIGTPRVSIDVEFAPLWQSPEYKNIAPLEQVDIDDTVHVYYEALGVEASAKVVKTVWNVLLERFDEVSLGDTRTTLSESIVSEAEETTTEAAGFLNTYVNGLTQIIANGLGLFTTRAPDAGGGVKLYLHNRPTLAESQYQWTINSNGFALSQDYGQTWSAGIDSEGNAVLNSLAANTINALTINGSVINSGKLYSGEQYWFAGTENEASMHQSTSVYDPEDPSGGEYKGVKLVGTAVTVKSINGVAVLANAESDSKTAAAGFVAIKRNGAITMRAKSGASAVLGASESTISSPNGKNYVRITDTSVEVRDKANNNIIMMDSSGVSITIEGDSVRDLGYVTIDVSGHRYKVLGHQEY